MKPRLLYLLPFSCLLVVLPLMAGPCYSQSPTAITESDIHALLNRIDRSTRKRNVAGIIAPLAKDVKIKYAMSTPGSAQEQKITLSKEQFAYNLRHNFRRSISYQYERKNTRIKIYSDQQTAMVTSEVYEVVTIREGTLRASSSEVLIVSLQNGKVVINSIEGRTRVY